MLTPHKLLVANVHFHSGDELRAALAQAERFTAVIKPTELDLRLHWQKHLLTKEYHELAQESMKRLVRDNNGLHLFSFLPVCFEDPMGLTCFPHCRDCVFHEAKWCKWPRQFTDKYYRTPQKSLGSFDPYSLSLEDFYGTDPVTWFTPRRREMAMLADLFSRFESVVDFGCGSGFVDSLLLEEGLKSSLIGVDPFTMPNLSHPSFRHQMQLGEMRGDWALLSCLGDYHVPVETCFTGNAPKLAAFIAFPQVFGRGGERMIVDVDARNVRETSTRKLFAFDDLREMNYELILRRPIPSEFFQDTELRIYGRDANCKEWIRESDVSAYPWENSPRRAAISTISLA